MDGLQGVNVAVKRGELVAVVGPYGSGKSSLIKAALGEIQPRPGAHVHLYGSVAYVGQRPWIFNASARDNVLFGEPFEETRYNWAVAGACLETDFAALEFGDATMIGERGCNLSGGQKLRVGLARALYSNADILLLDDILSAVDAHVASALFFDTLKQRLRGKTVLLVTHALTFLPHTDRIFLLDNGTITATGTFESLKDHETLKQIQAAKGKKRQEGVKKNSVE
jgi:ATP-binding cassette subfamily C (CFTR/MRP) protein 2